MKNLRLCLIDDEFIYAFTIQKMLSWIDPSISFYHFPNGQEAADFFASEPNVHHLPHIVLLDLNMPVMNGWEFLDLWESWPKEKTCGIQLYLVSSSASSTDTDMAEQYSSIREYKVKPLRKEDLLKIVENYCQERTAAVA